MHLILFQKIGCQHFSTYILLEFSFGGDQSDQEPGIDAQISSGAFSEGHSRHGPGPEAGRDLETGISRRAGIKKDGAALHHGGTGEGRGLCQR
jgi:hypothetical protein